MKMIFQCVGQLFFMFFQLQDALNMYNFYNVNGNKFSFIKILYEKLVLLCIFHEKQRSKHIPSSLQVVHSLRTKWKITDLTCYSPATIFTLPTSRRSHATVFEVFPRKLAAVLVFFPFSLCEEKTFSCHDAFVLFFFSASFFWCNGKFSETNFSSQRWKTFWFLSDYCI